MFLLCLYSIRNRRIWYLSSFYSLHETATRWVQTVPWSLFTDWGLCRGEGSSRCWGGLAASTSSSRMSAAYTCMSIHIFVPNAYMPLFVSGDIFAMNTTERVSDLIRNWWTAIQPENDKSDKKNCTPIIIAVLERERTFHHIEWFCIIGFDHCIMPLLFWLILNVSAVVLYCTFHFWRNSFWLDPCTT